MPSHAVLVGVDPVEERYSDSPRRKRGRSDDEDNQYLLPDALGIKARLDEPGAGIVVQIEVVGRHADDGPVLLVHLLGDGVH